MEEKFLAEIKRLELSPPSRTEFVFYNMPAQVRGIDFHVSSDRKDLAAQEDRASKWPEIHIEWTGAGPPLIELHARPS
jgi:hypothetical protein